MVYNTKGDQPEAAPRSGGSARKEQILALLLESGGRVSGQDISARLGISRAAVGKHVAALRREGHLIEAAPRRGFFLRVPDRPPRSEEIAPRLRSRIIGKALWRSLQETGSTNNEAVAWAAAGAPEGSVVLAERQTCGRGRKGQDWFSAPRGLQFSLILRPEAGPLGGLEPKEAQGLFTRLGALCVAEAIREKSGLSPALKEPNDVLLNGRKVSGILVEIGLRGGEQDWVVLGIGCNVNALAEEFPEELRGKTCSLLSESGLPVARQELLTCLLERLDFWYAALNSSLPSAFASAEKALRESWRSGGTLAAD